jgi:alpha-galactosidase
MARKFAFIGAGSNVFTRNLSRDILTFPAFQDATIALMDIDDERLAYAAKVVRKIVKEGKRAAKVIATKSRAEALDGADGVLATIMVGGTDARYNDVRIPMKYGVDQNIADTRGPGGIYKFLRTWPAMRAIIRDIERYCPGAVFLNYTNPMAMLCRGMQAVSPATCVTGLCHSVQGTAGMLARFMGKPMSEVTYVCAGINHQAFYIDLRWKGEDAYPLLRKALTTNKKILNEEQVRNEMFLQLDYYVTESSGHNSEYNPWFRKRPDLIEKYCTHGTGWNPGKSASSWLDGYEDGQKAIKKGTEEPWWRKGAKEFLAQKKIDLKRSEEYASSIFNAVFGDNRMFEFNGNVRNFGIIDNLPYGCCVEVPVLASKRGLSPEKVGKLPPQLAALISQNAQLEEMVVEGALSGNRRMVQQALLFDPLTAAVCSMDETKRMFDAMWRENKDDLKWFGKV